MRSKAHKSEHQKRRPRVRAMSLLFFSILATTSARAQTYWPDGYEVELTLKPSQTKYLPGETPGLVLEIKNHSDTNLEILFSARADGSRHLMEGFDLSVVAPDGVVVPRPPATEGGPGLYDDMFVEAGHTVEFFAALQSRAKLDKPGTYTVTCRSGLTVNPYTERTSVLLDMDKPATEVHFQTQFEVVAAEQERTGKLIDELGAKTLDKDQASSSAAAAKLSSIKDERVVKYFVEAIRESKNPSVRYTALGALSRFDSDSALEGLKLGARDADVNFRTAAAVGLSHSKHPKSAEALLAMRDDKYYGVRLVVLYKLERIDTDDARRMIWEMANDENKSVSDEALRYLQTGVPGIQQ